MWSQDLLRFKRRRRIPKADFFLAFLDYAYMPYALGDTFTWIENAQVLAREAGTETIDVIVLTSRERPAATWQPHINAHNFVSHVHGLIPAFLSSPMVRNIHLVENRQTFYAMVTDMHDRGASMWPSVEALTRERINFMSHLGIVEHFRKNGSIPLLSPPRGYEQQARGFIERFCPDKFTVVVNVRQSHLRSARAQPERDSQFETWAEFIRSVARKYSDVAFVVVGQYCDVDRRFERLPATTVPRSHGLGLGAELTILQGADLFMGTSSGFAQAALFGHPSYIVTNTEPRAAPICGVEVGARHHPFGRADQIVTWSLETLESLGRDFDKVLAAKLSNGCKVPRKFV